MAQEGEFDLAACAPVIVAIEIEQPQSGAAFRAEHLLGRGPAQVRGPADRLVPLDLGIARALERGAVQDAILLDAVEHRAGARARPQQAPAAIAAAAKRIASSAAQL